MAGEHIFGPEEDGLVSYSLTYAAATVQGDAQKNVWIVTGSVPCAGPNGAVLSWRICGSQNF